MKVATTNTTNEGNSNTQTGSAVRGGYAASCQKVLAQIAAVRAAVLAESRQVMAVPEQLVRLALNEAEALAWQTTYPQLVFPTLAVEKVQAVAQWRATQQAVRRDSATYATML